MSRGCREARPSAPLPGMRASCLALALALVVGRPVHAVAQQAATARVQGTVWDSLRARPLGGATVTLVRVSPEPQRFLSVTTDSSGRFLADSLTPGRYSIGVATPLLDSLEIQLPPLDTTLAAGAQLRVDFATPSRDRLVAAACAGMRLARGRGAIVGRVMDADSDTPIAGATVALSWTDVGLDVRHMRATKDEKVGALVTDQMGQYRACGVPTDTYVTLQVQHAGRAGIAVRAVAADSVGVMVQNLSMSRTTARVLAAESTASADTATALATGTAGLAGVVRGSGGKPLADAVVRVVDAAGSTRSDAEGRFVLASLPAGTQVVEARRVGYLVTQQTVELRAGRTIAQDVPMTRIVMLDSVRVLARRERLRDFEHRAAAASATGALITSAEIARRAVTETGDLFRGGSVLGFHLVGTGVDAKVRSARGIGSFRANCDANIVIDGIQHQDINLVDPASIAGIEVYRGASGAPIEYESPCGVIVIWTRQ